MYFYKYIGKKVESLTKEVNMLSFQLDEAQREKEVQKTELSRMR
jgi:hypothetical protein